MGVSKWVWYALAAIAVLYLVKYPIPAAAKANGLVTLLAWIGGQLSIFVNHLGS